MKTYLSAGAILLLGFCLSTGAFAQSTVGTITGIVTAAADKAVLPNVTVRVINEDTGVRQVMFTNDSGVYSFLVAPGTNYTVSAELVGFRRATIKGITLHMADAQRVDIGLEFGEVTKEIIVDAKRFDPLLELPNIGVPLDEKDIKYLPMTVYDPLSLVMILPGYRASSMGHEFDTLGGLPMSSVNTVRDGLSVTDGFTPGGVGSTTLLNPDMIAEIRLILAPVDPESGRGNGQIQITTKSGTNKFQWNINYNLRQNALNSLGPSPTRQKQPFNAAFQYVVSAGGPVIKDRTFYFVNWDHQLSFRRPTNASCVGGASGCGGYLAVPVLTDPARNGIFRWFDGWIETNSSFAEPASATGATATWPIDPSGLATAPAFWPVTNAPYTGTLKCISVFGSVKVDGTPFDPATDCGPYIPRAADGTLDYAHPKMGVGVLPGPGSSDWDGFGRVPDRTGYIQRLIGYMPRADYYYSNFINGGQISSSGADGLNRAAFDWVRGTSGLSDRNTFNGGTFGTGLTLDQQWVGHKTINIKIDHNIDSRNHISVGTSFQNDQNQRAGFESRWPDGVNGYQARIPRVLTFNGLSSLTPHMVNEARFGITYNRSTQLPPWENPADQSQADFARSFLQQGWQSAASGRISPIYYQPGSGTMDFSSNILPAGSNSSTGASFLFGQPAGGASSRPCLNTTSVASTNCETGYGLYNLADTFTFNHGDHSFRAGVEYRMTRAHEVMSSVIPSATAGSLAATTPRLGTASTTPELPDFVTGADGGLLSTMRTNARDLLYFLSGSVSQLSQQFWVNNVDNFKNGTWDTWDTGDGKQARNSLQNEYAFFLKDDWKIGKRLTLNLGMRYENYGNLYIRGFSTGVEDSGLGLFGAARGRGANPFDYWLTPGNYYVTGYGLTAPALDVTGQVLPNGAPSFIPGNTQGVQTAAAQSFNVTVACIYGITQSPLLPASNCQPNLLTTRVFVGPGSDHPDQAPTYVDRNNIGSAIGFSYRMPVGTRTFLVRGGFQFTYGSAGRDRSVATGTGGVLSQQNGGSTLTGAIDQLTISCGATTACPGLDPSVAFTLADLPYITPLAPTASQVPTLGGNLGATSTQSTTTSQAFGSAHVAAITAYAPHFQDARTENYTFSISTNLTRTSTLALSYVGTIGRNRPTAIDVNTPNVYHNPELLDALVRTRAGEDAPLFDQMLAGLNISGLTASSGYGNIGTCVAPSGANAAILTAAALGGGAGNCPAGTFYQSGSAHLRRSATFQTNLANGNFNAVAANLAALNPSTTNGSVLASNTVWRGLIQGNAVRNGCDRLASATATNHWELINGGAATGNSGSVRCFPEDYIVMNPGGSAMTYKDNWGYTNYQQLQIQYTLRLPRGVNMQATYLTSKTMALPRDFYKTNTFNYNSNGANGFSSPGSTSGLTGFADPQTEETRRMDYGLSSDSLKHAFRLNGVLPLPIGPGQALLGKTSGIIGKILGGWQMALILNAQSGQPFGIYAGDMLYGSSSGVSSSCNAFSGTTFGSGANCQSGLSFPDVVSPLWTTPQGKLETNGPNGSSTYFGNPSPFALIRDPQCDHAVGRSSTSDIGNVAAGALGTFNLANSCSLNALVMKVAPGTPGAFPLSATDPTPVLIMLQNPLPGHQGSLGAQTMRQPGRFYLDANLLKAFMFTEKRGIQLRVDATNVLNHPQPADLYFSLGPGGTFNDQSTAALRSLANGCATQNTTGVAGCGRQVQVSFRMINN